MSPVQAPAHTTALDQLDALVALGFPKAARMSQQTFRALADGLSVPPEDNGCLLVVSTSLVPAHEQIARSVLAGKPGFTSMDSDDLAHWQPIVDVELPDTPLWMVHDVDTGLETLSVRPDDALPAILASGRSPLTLEEGLAVAIHRPQWLKERNCFEMLGSRAGDKRVTGVWLSAGRPRLGWCWGGNPHTWLGMASCARRSGPAG